MLRKAGVGSGVFFLKSWQLLRRRGLARASKILGVKENRGVLRGMGTGVEFEVQGNLA